MAIGNLTNYGDDVGIGRIFADSFEDAVYINNELFGLTINGVPLFPDLKVCDSRYRWKLRKSGNTSAAVFAEGEAAPTPVAGQYANLSVPYTYFWAWARISGHVRDVAENQGMSDGIDVISNEFTGGFEDIKDAVNTGFMGASNNGLEVAIDSTTTYAGQARGSAAWFESKETAQSAALSRAGLINIMEASHGNDFGGKTGIILTPLNQVSNYIYLTGEPNAENSSVRVEMGTAGGGRLDLVPDAAKATVGGIPVVPIAEFTTTIWMGLDIRPTKLGPNLGKSVRRRNEVRGPQMSGDDDVYELSTALTPIVHMPKRCWKLTGVTA